MGLWIQTRSYQITQLSEQKYRLVIPFAENNFGPFAHIVFVIVLFESPSKTLLRVLFASLYLQICIFYQYILFLVWLWARSELIPTGNTTENRQNNATFVSYDLAQRRSGHYTTMHRFSLIFGIEFCESLKDVCRKIVVVYRDFSLWTFWFLEGTFL
jgi:hypothetical protein